MEIEIQTQRNNALLNRTEVRFLVHHDGESSPRRELVRTELADKLHTKKDNVIVDHMKTAFGIYTTSGYAKVYTSLEKAKAGERQHLIKRNTPGGGDDKDKGKPKEKKQATEVTKDELKEEAKEGSEDKPAPAEEPKEEPSGEQSNDEEPSKTLSEQPPEKQPQEKPEEEKADT